MASLASAVERFGLALRVLRQLHPLQHQAAIADQREVLADAVVQLVREALAFLLLREDQLAGELLLRFELREAGLFDGLRGHVAFVDVADRSGHPARPAAFVPDRLTARAKPAEFGSHAKAQIDVERQVAIDVEAQCGLGAVVVVGMNQRGQRLGPYRLGIARRALQQLQHAGREEQPPGVAIPFPDAVVRAGHGELEAFLAAHQRVVAARQHAIQREREDQQRGGCGGQHLQRVPPSLLPREQRVVHGAPRHRDEGQVLDASDRILPRFAGAGVRRDERRQRLARQAAEEPRRFVAIRIRADERAACARSAGAPARCRPR